MREPHLNPHLRGQRCLRCGQGYGLEDLFEGCPSCAGEGCPASVRAVFREEASSAPRARLPVLGGASLGEGQTPLIDLPSLAKAHGLASLALKAEYLNPTGSHKDRMSQQATAWAALRGWDRVIAASSGNAGVSLAAYAARMGLACTILVKEGTGGAWLDQMKAYGAEIEVLPTAHARWERQRQRVKEGFAFPVTNHLLPPVGSNPMGVQGYKSVGWELFEQRGGDLDFIFVPTARGDLLWGIWEGYSEAARASGPGPKPSVKMIAVEPYPRLSRALKGEDHRQTFPGSSRQRSIEGGTVTWQSLHTLRASGGWAVEVGDATAGALQRQLRERGMALELCSAAAVGAVGALAPEQLEGKKAVVIATSDGRYETYEGDDVHD